MDNKYVNSIKSINSINKKDRQYERIKEKNDDT